MFRLTVIALVALSLVLAGDKAVEAGRYYTANDVQCVRNGLICKIRKARPARRAGAFMREVKPVRRFFKRVFVGN